LNHRPRGYESPGHHFYIYPRQHNLLIFNSFVINE